jgi:hypothetical protein
MYQLDGLTVVFEVCLGHRMEIHSEVLYPTQLLHLLGSVQELCEVAEILRHPPENLFRIDMRMIPLHELLSRGKILGYGFL